MDFKENDLPNQLNLAVRSNSFLSTDRQIDSLKKQNKLLSDEIVAKNSHISKMDKEKSSLLKELLQVRAYVDQNSESFMWLIIF